MKPRSSSSSSSTSPRPQNAKNIPAQTRPRLLPFTQTFTSQRNSDARNAYLRIFILGSFLIVLTIFVVFSIYWGALWETPIRNLGGWVVDFDNALIGQAVTQALTSPPPQSAAQSKITWSSIPASQFPGGLQQLADEVIDQKVWVVIAVNKDATTRLLQSYTSPNKAYNGSQAITVYAAEARNENAFRVIISPSVQAQLTAAVQEFSLQAPSRFMNGTNLNISAILETSPQTVLAPIGYTMNNLLPFDEPIGSAVTFVGMIFLLILSYFVTVIGFFARDISGINTRLTLRSLVMVRFASAFGAYFFISFFYTLLNQAFQLDFTKKFGKGGFVIFWMLHWVGMLSVGLALESLITLLTPGFIPFFLITWIIANVSVSMLPIEVLSVVFRYGYAAPFYNISHAARCILFGTKNTVGINFAILIAWVAVSCITLPLFQWFLRRGVVRALEIGRVIDRSGDIGNIAVVPRKDLEVTEGNRRLQGASTMNEKKDHDIDGTKMGSSRSIVSIPNEKKEALYDDAKVEKGGSEIKGED